MLIKVLDARPRPAARFRLSAADLNMAALRLKVPNLLAFRSSPQ